MGSHVTAPGEQLGVRCLAQGHLSRGIEGGYSPHQQSLPDLRFEPTTFGLRVRLSKVWPGSDSDSIKDLMLIYCLCIIVLFCNIFSKIL